MNNFLKAINTALQGSTKVIDELMGTLFSGNENEGIAEFRQELQQFATDTDLTDCLYKELAQAFQEIFPKKVEALDVLHGRAQNNPVNGFVFVHNRHSFLASPKGAYVALDEKNVKDADPVNVLEFN